MRNFATNHINMAGYRKVDELTKAQAVFWMKKHKASYLQVSEKFGVSRKSIASWVKNVNMRSVGQRFPGQLDIDQVGDASTNMAVENEINKNALTAIERIEVLSQKSCTAIEKWIEWIEKRLDTKTGRNLTAQEVQQLVKILEVVSKYQLAQKTNDKDDDKPKQSAFDLFREQIGNAYNKPKTLN